MTRAETRKQIIDHLRDPLMSSNTDAALARMFDVTRAWVAKLREEVEAEGTAFQKGTFRELQLEGLRLDGGTQPRAELDRKVSREYRDDLKAGSIFPPIGVVYDGTDYWVWDGFHRVDAYAMAGRETIQAEVRQGTRREAVLLAAGANSGHGLRRTNDDKRRAVEHLLRDDEWVKWSNEEIARKCCVSPPTVAKIRAELEKSGEITPKTFRAGADGKTYDTTNTSPQPSANGHASSGGTQQSAPAQAATAQPAASPPMAQPVVVDRKISVALSGEPEADFARLIESYPVSALAKLGQLIRKEFKEDSGPCKIHQGHMAVVNRLREGPASTKDLVEINLRAVGRIWELNRSGYVIEKRDGKWSLLMEPCREEELCH